MAGYTVNNKSNADIEKDTGYVRAGQGGKRHRFDLKSKGKPKAKAKPDMLNDLGDGKDSDFGGLASDPGDGAMDAMSPFGPLDQDVNAIQPPPAAHPAHIAPAHAPVAVHIHLSPSDHNAFKGMARSKKKNAIR